MKNIRRICISGGPSIGKTTMVSRLFYDLKVLNHRIELIPEPDCLREWVFKNQGPKSFDQIYLLANQIHKKDIALSHGCSLTITDAPLALSCYYAKMLGADFWQHEVEIVKKFDQKFLPLVIHLTGKIDKEKYNRSDRFQSFEEAICIDKEILDFMNDWYKTENVKVIDRTNYNGLLEYAISKIGEPK